MKNWRLCLLHIFKIKIRFSRVQVILHYLLARSLASAIFVLEWTTFLDIKRHSKYIDKHAFLNDKALSFEHERKLKQLLLAAALALKEYSLH